MKRLLAAVTLIFLLASTSFALSDSEYLKMKKNANFSRADRRLTSVWNGLKKSLSKENFNELQKYQREWLKTGRDEAAQAFIDEGYSRTEAYTMATNARAEILPELAESIAHGDDGTEEEEYIIGNTNAPERIKTPQKQEHEPKIEEYIIGRTEENNIEDDKKGEIEEERFSNSKPGDPEGNYSSNKGFMTVIITDRSSMEAAVTISLNNGSVTWSSMGWIDDDVLILSDPSYGDCEATLTFSGNGVKIETSKAEGWKNILGEGLTLDGTYKKN